MERFKEVILAGMLGMLEQDTVYSTRLYIRRYNSNYKVKLANRVLREFTVNGKKIMAFSRKDAIKRLKHS